MARTGRTIIGVFNERAMADQAIDALQAAGFAGDQIHSSGHHTSGGFLTGLKSFFTGEDATTTDITDDLTGMGVSNEEARYYENEHQAGRSIVAVEAATGREQEAMNILRTNGAYTYGTQRGTAQTGRATTSASTLQTTDTAETDEDRVLRLREEQLDVNKQRVQSGEVKLRKEIVTEPKTINVPVTHEEAFIERRPVTDASMNDATPIGADERIRVPLSEEKVNVSKDTVVTGEVAVGKRAVQENQQVTDTVKREEARLEQDGNLPVHGAENVRVDPGNVNEKP